MIENLQIVEINMDKIKKIWKEKKKEVKKYKHVLMLMLEREEIKKLKKEEKGDKIIMAYEKEINKINKDFVFEWDYEKDNEMLINSLKKEYREEGEAKGIQKGHLAGLKEGKTSIAQNLKKMNMSLDFIAKALNVSKNQAMQLLQNSKI